MPEYSKEFIIEKAKKIKAQSFDKVHSHNFKKGRDDEDALYFIYETCCDVYRELINSQLYSKIGIDVTRYKDLVPLTPEEIYYSFSLFFDQDTRIILSTKKNPDSQRLYDLYKSENISEFSTLLKTMDFTDIIGRLYQNFVSNLDLITLQQEKRFKNGYGTLIKNEFNAVIRLNQTYEELNANRYKYNKPNLSIINSEARHRTNELIASIENVKVIINDKLNSVFISQHVKTIIKNLYDKNSVLFEGIRNPHSLLPYEYDKKIIDLLYLMLTSYIKYNRDITNIEIDHKENVKIQKKETKAFFQEFFKFENSKSKNLFYTNFLSDFSNYITSIGCQKDLFVLCLLLFPDYRYSGGENRPLIVGSHLINGLCWKEEPENLISVVNIICKHFDHLNKYNLELSSTKPSQLRPDLLEKAIKNKIEGGKTWMKNFINEYWPEKMIQEKILNQSF